MLRIITYHRVAPINHLPNLSPRMINATPEVFQQQMNFLAGKYRVVSMEDVLNAFEKRATLPKRAVLITFDDAYRDFIEFAWPILKKLNLPVTVFVPTSYPNHPERSLWWDRLYVAFNQAALNEITVTPIGVLPLQTPAVRLQSLKRLQNHIKTLEHSQAMSLVDEICRQLSAKKIVQKSVLDWDELRKLAREGVTIGAHTRTHPIMTRLSPQQMREEIVGSREDITREIGDALPIFCYPSGGFNKEIVEVLKTENFKLAVSTIRGHNDLSDTDPFYLRRTNITRRTTLPVFRLRLARWMAAIDNRRHRDNQTIVGTNGIRTPNMNETNLDPKSEATDTRNNAQENPPKVAYIMSRFPKISETFILFEMIEQERNGVQIELYPLLHEKQPVSHPEVEKYLQRANFHPFVSLPILKANWHYFSHKPMKYLELFFELLFSAFGSLNFTLGVLVYFPKAVRFAYEMQQKGVSHIHAHFCNHPAVVAMIINRLTSIPFSFTAHGSDLHVEKRMLDKKVKASAFAVTVSYFNKEAMVKACGDWAHDKVHVIRCGIDTEVFVPNTEQETNGKLKVICIGSFEEVKGHKYLVEACQKLHERGIDFVCDFIGDGPVRKQVSEQIAATGLDNKIIIHGPKPRQEVVRMLKNADIKVLPSVPTAKGKREGVPVVLMEAMAMALPVVSSQLSGIPELVDDGKTGVLVPPRDVIGIANALQSLYEEPELRRKLGQAGREKVMREFNLKTNTVVLLDLIRRRGNGELK